jgi:very-short-patch-repair endonuclease
VEDPSPTLPCFAGEGATSLPAIQDKHPAGKLSFVAGFGSSVTDMRSRKGWTVAPSPAKRGRVGEGSSLTLRARQLRRDMTDAERLLWSRLRRNFLGVPFRRQLPIGAFIVDFVCLPKRLIIEVDGGQHLESSRDRARDAWLAENGFRVLRFWNYEVLRNLEGVLTRILEELGKG